MTPKKSAPSFSQEELDNRRRQFARILFLEQLDTTCQHVRKDLLKIWRKLESRIRAAISASQNQLDEAFDTIREAVLAKYDAPGEGAIGVSGPTENVWSWYRGASQGADPLRDQLESDIREWAQGYWIDTDWIINIAVENISKWFQDPAQEGRKSWFPPSVGMLGILTADDLKFQFSHQFWSGPLARTCKDMRTEGWGEFNTAFDEWYRKLSEKLKQRGYEKNLRWDDPDRDIRWLVRFQCVGEDYPKIAKAEKVSNDVVRKAVKKAARYLGIKRREVTSGRRSKKKPT